MSRSYAVAIITLSAMLAGVAIAGPGGWPPGKKPAIVRGPNGSPSGIAIVPNGGSGWPPNR
jgi:hypothetical protein